MNLVWHWNISVYYYFQTFHSSTDGILGSNLKKKKKNKLETKIPWMDKYLRAVVYISSDSKSVEAHQ